MKTIEITDEQYQALANAHGDVTAFIHRLASEAEEVAAVLESVEAAKRGEHVSLEDFDREFRAKYGIPSDA